MPKKKKNKEESMKVLSPEEKTVLDGIESAKKEELKIVGNSNQNGWNKIKKRRIKYEKENIYEWNKSDFFIYLKNSVLEKFNIKCNFTIFSGAASIGYVQEALRITAKRTISNDILKEYIDWFLANECENVISKYKRFSVKYLTFTCYIDNFVKLLPVISNYQSLKTQQTKDCCVKESSIPYLLTSDAMNAVYKLSKDNFVRRYGIIIPVMYLMHIQGLTEESAVKYVSDKIVAAVTKKESAFNQILENTAKFGPYPKDCKFGYLRDMVIELKEITGMSFDKVKIVFSSRAAMPEFMIRGMK